MYGYHFTSLLNWENIQLGGLRPGCINVPAIQQACDLDRGIWIFNSPLQEACLQKCLNWCHSRYGNDLCELRVDYLQDDLLTLPNGDVLFCWYGTRQVQWQAVILKHMIPPQQLRLTRAWGASEIS
jgi:hypothetical protein